MPLVRIRTGLHGDDGQEEELVEFICDAPDCPNVATEAGGCVRELGTCVAFCEQHVHQFVRPSVRHIPPE